MAYCSLPDITAVIPNDDLVQLTNDISGETVDSSKITDAITYSDSLIDGYLRGRYSLPLTSVPDIVKYLSVDLVVFRLYSRRMYTNLPEIIVAKQEQAVKTLKDIQTGKFNLGIEDTAAFSDPALKTNKTSLTASNNKFYNSDKWDEYDKWL